MPKPDHLPILRTALTRILGDVSVEELISLEVADEVVRRLGEQIEHRLGDALRDWSASQKPGLTDDFRGIVPRSSFEVILRIEGRAVQIDPETEREEAERLAEIFNRLYGVSDNMSNVRLSVESDPLDFD